MHAILDDWDAALTCKPKHGIEVSGDPERVLEHDSFCPAGDALFQGGQIHVAGVNAAVDEDRAGARVPDRIGYHDMRRNLNHDIVAVSEPQCLQDAEQGDSATREAVRVPDPDVAGESQLVPAQRLAS